MIFISAGAGLAKGDVATSNALSPVGVSLQQAWQDATQAAHTTATQRQVDLAIALIEACSRASEDGWDAYGGRGVSPTAYITAGALLRVLPEQVPLPEISVHPDGELALDWVVGKRKTFTISVAEDGTLSYAGLFGKNKVTGREVFFGVFPATLIPHIKRLDEGDADGRQA